jgi:hypothetical protein
MPVLQQGSSGPDVIDLQKKLLQRGFDPGASDGSFGPGTAAAVVAFQRSAGLAADGVVGPQTAAALGLAVPAPVASLIPAVTIAMVCQMFPNTPKPNIEQNLPVVLNALVAPQLANKPMILMAQYARRPSRSSPSAKASHPLIHRRAAIPSTSTISGRTSGIRARLMANGSRGVDSFNLPAAPITKCTEMPSGWEIS